MAFNVKEFVAKLEYAGQRPNLFDVRFSGKDELDIPIDFDLLPFRACAIRTRGRKMEIDIIEDENFSTRDLLRKFRNCSYPRIEVHTYSKTGKITSTHRWEVIKSSIYWDTDLAWDDYNSIMSWTLHCDVIDNPQ